MPRAAAHDPTVVNAIPESRRAWLRVLPIAAGSGLLVWHVAAAWAWVMLAGSFALLVGVLVSPAFAQKVVRAMRWFEAGVTRAATWLLLGLVFVFVFVPGRLVLCMMGDARFGRRATESYWRRLDNQPTSGGFDRPY